MLVTYISNPVHLPIPMHFSCVLFHLTYIFLLWFNKYHTKLYTFHFLSSSLQTESLLLSTSPFLSQKIMVLSIASTYLSWYLFLCQLHVCNKTTVCFIYEFFQAAQREVPHSIIFQPIWNYFCLANSRIQVTHVGYKQSIICPICPFFIILFWLMMCHVYNLPSHAAAT